MHSPAFQTVATRKAMMIQTEPSNMPAVSRPRISKLQATILSEAEEVPYFQEEARQPPVPRVDEPNLYNLPTGLYPTYRPLPLLSKILEASMSIVVSITTTWKRSCWIQPLITICAGVETCNLNKLARFLGKALLLTFVSNIVLQEIFLPPSRVSIDTLRDRYFLPSTLSRYQTVTTSPKNNESPLGVHLLRYENTQPVKTPRFQALYINHGFGASSLSWLPALPSLVNKVGARVGLGHDAVGFGFTDRPKDISSYTSQSSSIIGANLLNVELQKAECPEGNPAVLLAGHSMGCLTTLRMALQLPIETRRLVVLVAPALGVFPSSQSRGTASRSQFLRPLLPFLKDIFVTPPLTYVLRRVVGKKNFWKSGLRQVWGDAARLTESDVLRFQWPSIGKGWEDGLLKFSRAQLQPSDMTDSQLLENVLALPNTSVAIIHGTADRVISKGLVKKIVDAYPQIKFVEMEDLGHDPFEEQTDNFIGLVENILEEDPKFS